MKEILAIIPARGGSKGLPDKNILPLSGHPLIAYSIKAALDAPSVSRVIVSTDSEKIAAIALQYGAEVPFLRPAAIADDFSTDLEVFQHALQWLSEHELYTPDLVLQLRPTSPFRTVDMIEMCIQKLTSSECDSLRIVTKSFHTPYKMWRIEDTDQPMVPLLQLPGYDEPYNQPRQKLPEVYWQIGTLDVIRPEVITRGGSMSGKKVLPHVIAQEFAIDIDDLASFQKAGQLIALHHCVKFDT
ncbi:N-acylneuraminate cytidylyltransferase [Dyadobacter sp. CECT 9275]|uniref:N-acylneuraminate cytidylyltransferase n=1 Tax=Dyadobacter helix TaxID=2822344 RepID=A0A916JER4_9BACT|nr:acylneuraminate cytidylyltransferase family protein [Dyadobacter sp. CECT 9275]CAG5007939.1 N-acylneuraminate cytidylyltransferase [Dyadobacter sp. CECT 9275]